MSFRIVTGDWESVREDAQRVRIEVFVIEQNVPIELEWDEGDEVSTHAIAYDEERQPVATGQPRLPQQQGETGQMQYGPLARRLTPAAAAAFPQSAQRHSSVC